MKKMMKVALIATTITGITAGMSNVKAMNLGLEQIRSKMENKTFVNFFFDKDYNQILAGESYSSTGLTTQEDSDGNLTITGYSGSETNIEIPKTIDGKNVVKIGNKAFQSNTTIKKLKITADITSIGEFAFCNCSSLEEVEFPNSLTTIEGYAFLECPIQELNLPSQIRIIKSFAFQGINATEVVLPESLKQLHSSAFRACRSLKTVKVYSRDLVYDYDYGRADDESKIFEYCPSDLVLYGYSGSTTQTYASEQHITFRELTADVEVTGVTLNKNNLSLNVGGSETLTVTVSPNDATNKTITWTTDKESVASVSSSGVVTGVSEGNATITATSNNGKKATCTVVVNAEDNKSIFFEPAVSDGTVFHLAVGSEKDIKVGVSGIPESEIANMTCVSGDTSIITVGAINPENKSFKLKALKVGKVTLTATLVYSGHTYTATYDVDVKDKYADYYTFEITGENTVAVGSTIQLKVEEKTIDASLPKQDKSEEATWSTSDGEILKVDGKGLVTGVKEGKATVIADYENSEAELSAEYEVTVTENELGVSKLEIQKKPSRTEYNIGDKIDIDDGELLITYDDGTTRTISMGNNDVTVEGFDTSKEGDIEVTLTYKGKSVTLNFTVKKASEDKGDGDDKGKDDEEDEEEEEKKEKVDTGDNIVETIIALVASALLIILATIGIKGKKKKESEEENSDKQ